MIVVLALACSDDKPTKPKPVPENPLVISLQRTDWRTASRPYDGLVSSKLLWHNSPPILVSDVYDTNSSAAISPLRLVYRYYGIEVEPGRVDLVDEPYTWKAIRIPTNPDIDWSMVQYLTIRAKATAVSMYIDIGRISDDLNSDAEAYSEDVSFNGHVEEEEDVGLDGRPDYLEPGYDAATNPDPSGDNWFTASGGTAVGVCPMPTCPIDWFDELDDPMYYDYLNGTEGNRFDIASLGQTDREQLSDEYFEVTNSYFSYRLNFASGTFLVPGSEYNGWATYRIPLKDSLALDSLVADQGLIPAWSQIRVMRIRFVSESVESEQPDTVLIAEWHFEERP
jgi:hypothetical protein